MMTHLLVKHSIKIYCIANLLTAILVVAIFSFDYIPQWAPGLFAVLFVLILKGKAGVYALFESLSFKYEHLKWYLRALLFPILFCSFAYAIISFIEDKEPACLQLSHSWSDYAIWLLFITWGSLGEELGWRGFMLPQLLNKYSLFTSSLGIGIFWGIWHLNILLGIPVFIIYLVLVTEFSFISSWFYVKTKKNVLAVVILHTSIDLCAVIFFEKIVTAEFINRQTMFLLYGTMAISFLPLCFWAVRDMLRST